MFTIGNVQIKSGAILAPMAGVSDPAFRAICHEMDASMTITEMISAQGLYYSPDKAAQLRYISPGEHPIAMQLFGNDGKLMAQMAKVYGEDFDIIDINMGCPAPKVVKNDQGSALMKTPSVAQDIVKRMKDTLDKPVTVKIRTGWDATSINAVPFAMAMEEAGADGLCIHGRTREEFYHGHADWGIITKVKEALTIPVIGNGDVRSDEDAVALMKQSGCDAIMVGRAAEGNPFIFREIKHYIETGEPLPKPTIGERMDIVVKHAMLLMDIYDEYLMARMMRKHLSWYTKGIPNASTLRSKAVAVKSLEDIKTFADLILSHAE